MEWIFGKKKQSLSEGDFPVETTVDEDGFVCLVCPDTYRGYVSDDWTLDQLLERFTEQMNRGTCFVAYPGPELTNVPLRIAAQKSETTCIREVSVSIRAGKGGLWLTDYTQMTMAAQFSDEKPVDRSGALLPVPPGSFRLTLRQFANTRKDNLNPALELVIEPEEGKAPKTEFTGVPWFDR